MCVFGNIITQFARLLVYNYLSKNTRIKAGVKKELVRARNIFQQKKDLVLDASLEGILAVTRRRRKYPTKRATTK
jgi:hypothetical protein